MARATDRNAFKNDAERTFPHRVDISVPGSGLGRRLTDMHAWCSANERRKGFQPVEFARFYFMREADAASFRAQWVAD
jgi:hypothetical protein